MSKQKLRSPWYEEALAKLDRLVDQSSQYCDEDDILPSEQLICTVKRFIVESKDYRLPIPSIRFSPNGNVAITWEKNKEKIKVIFEATGGPKCYLSKGLREGLLTLKEREAFKALVSQAA